MRILSPLSSNTKATILWVIMSIASKINALSCLLVHHDPPKPIIEPSIGVTADDRVLNLCQI